MPSENSSHVDPFFCYTHLGTTRRRGQFLENEGHSKLGKMSGGGQALTQALLEILGSYTKRIVRGRFESDREVAKGHFEDILEEGQSLVMHALLSASNDLPQHEPRYQTAQ